MSIQEPRLEADDIQGHILTGFGRAYELLLGVKMSPEKVDAAKTAMREIADDVTPVRKSAKAKAQRRLAASAGEVPVATNAPNLAIAVSGAGLAGLGADPGKIVDPIFGLGPGGSAAALGDAVDGHGQPEGWYFGDTPDREPDILLLIASADEDRVRATAARYLTLLGNSVTVVLNECCRRIARDTEHFGFVDSISQPGVRGTVADGINLTPRAYSNADPQSALWARPGQRLTWPGQFVFGYPGLNPDDAQHAGEIVGDDPFLRNGSLLVVRRLSQNVGSFWKAMEDLAQQFSAVTGIAWSAEKAASRCVGRWKDGTPVTLSPNGEDAAIASDFYRRNGFKFVSPIGATTLTDADGDHLFPGAIPDPLGKACPFFGHIRKVNPRDHSHDFGGAGSTLGSQMLRRGVPFGPDWTGSDDGADRGLMFMSYQTSIQHAFYRLMTEWVKDPLRPIPGGIDPIIGPSPPAGRDLTALVDGQTATLKLDGQFVRATGAGYFFAPGIQTMKSLFAPSPAIV